MQFTLRHLPLQCPMSALNMMLSDKGVICICTRFRNQLLLRLLASLSRVRGIDRAKRVIIIDNSPDFSASQISFGSELPIRFVHEPRSGLSNARNRALDEARIESPSWVAFLDDDEIATEDWLENALTCLDTQKADVVAGAVQTIYPSGTRRWIIELGLLDHVRWRDGQVLKEAYTNNVIFRASVLNDPVLRFNEAFNFSGGEDTEFFRRVARRGYMIVWCEKALVLEETEALRMKPILVLLKHFQYGNTEIRVEFASGASFFSRVRGVAYGMIRFGVGLASLMCWPLMSTVSKKTALKRLFRGLGIAAGACGIRFRHYARDKKT